MKYPDKCGKQWKMKQIKPGWQKNRKKEQKKERFRKLTVKEEMEIARMVEEKQDKEKNLIETRTVKEIVSRRFYKYLKMFEKELKRILMRKT